MVHLMVITYRLFMHTFCVFSKRQPLTLTEYLKVDIPSNAKIYIFIYTPKPQSTFGIMPFWNI